MQVYFLTHKHPWRRVARKDTREMCLLLCEMVSSTDVDFLVALRSQWMSPDIIPKHWDVCGPKLQNSCSMQLPDWCREHFTWILTNDESLEAEPKLHDQRLPRCPSFIWKHFLTMRWHIDSELNATTHYKKQYHKSHPLIKIFGGWNVKSYDNEVCEQ